jgi:hypothetical protein
MSWKSFVTAGLLCVLASPAFAAPTVDGNDLNGTQASNHLNNDGNWVWTIKLLQSNPAVNLPDPDGAGPLPDPVAGSPLAAELGFAATGRALVSASVNATDFDDPNPGNNIWGWENDSDTDGSGGPTADDEPVGLQTNCAGGGCTENTPGDDPNTVFSAFGSVDYLGNTTGKNYLTIITAPPSPPTPMLNPSRPSP